MTSGLIQNREEFLLPDDAYPVLINAYVWRERILRKKGYQLLGRLQRNIGTTDGSGNATITINPQPIQSGIASFIIGTDIFTDQGGASPVTMITNSSGSGILDRATGVLTITGSQINTAVQYFPGLPVMGIRLQEQQNSGVAQTIFFDQNYAYIFNTGTNQFQEFISGTTWNKHAADVTGTDFFWSTNYWVSFLPLFSTTNQKLFWVTNNTGQYGATQDPPRITDGTTWIDFFPSTWSQIDATNYLTNFAMMLPFRGRMVVFNTYEGTSAGTAQNFYNRIRWSTIGNPFIAYTAGPPAAGSWRDDIRGQGGFLDIPTSEDIVSVGFVRDNLVIYCERSTWQLRYTGRSIAPFQIEKVNSELGAASINSSVQFDTSLLAIGERGIVECDSYKSDRIDIKIPDYVFQLGTQNNGYSRICGIRDFERRLAYWTFPFAPSNSIFPTQRLVYNYENDSWAIFTDSLTVIGQFQPGSSRTWLNTEIPWIECDFTWIDQPASVPTIVGGNQQGFVEYLDETTTNDVSLFISNITSSSTTPVQITSPNHNMSNNTVIKISGIVGTPYSDLNGQIFGIVVLNANVFELFSYDSTTGQFSNPKIYSSSPGTYQGGGLISIRDNFVVTSKKFNFIDEGQSILLGYIDILMNATESSNPGAISLNVFEDYDDVNPTNTLPNNQIDNGDTPITSDSFFNTVIPTTQSNIYGQNIAATKFWQRVYCSTRANFVTIQYTLSNAQLAGIEQEQDVQIDAQVLWVRASGRLTQP